MAEVIDILTGNNLFIQLIKPLLMPTLMVYLVISVQPEKLTTFLKIVFAALTFSWIGDIFLMFKWDNVGFFIFGLASFLFAHFLYIIAFSKNRFKGKKSIAQRYKPHWLAIMVVFGFSLIYYIVNNAAGIFTEVQLPVITYTIVIVLMFVSAINRENKVSNDSYQFVLAGATLFVLSDTLIAINRFTPVFEGYQIYARPLIMLFYCLSQYLIVEGCLRQALVSRNIIVKH